MLLTLKLLEELYCEILWGFSISKAYILTWPWVSSWMVGSMNSLENYVILAIKFLYFIPIPTDSGLRGGLWWNSLSVLFCLCLLIYFSWFGWEYLLTVTLFTTSLEELLTNGCCWRIDNIEVRSVSWQTLSSMAMESVIAEGVF